MVAYAVACQFVVESIELLHTQYNNIWCGYKAQTFAHFTKRWIQYLFEKEEHRNWSSVVFFFSWRSRKAIAGSQIQIGGQVLFLVVKKPSLGSQEINCVSCKV